MEQLILNGWQTLQPIMIPSVLATGWFALGILVAKIRDSR